MDGKTPARGLESFRTRVVYHIIRKVRRGFAGCVSTPSLLSLPHCARVDPGICADLNIICADQFLQARAADKCAAVYFIQPGPAHDPPQIFAFLEGIRRDRSDAVRKDDLLRGTSGKCLSPEIFQGGRKLNMPEAGASIKDKFPEVRDRIRQMHCCDLCVSGKEPVIQDRDRFGTI